jgi:RNA polymerase sigma-70 factor (ECF subfamily)
MDLETDCARLISRIAAGDLASFQRFYARHAAGVLAYLRQVVRPAHLAEDLVQEVFVRVWRKAGSFQSERGDAAGWLYTIARHQLIDHWRRSGGKAELADFDFEPVAADSIDRHDLLLTLRKALQQVQPEQRRAIEMAYFGGFTYQETARRLRLPLGTLKSRIRIGLKTLRSVLEAG